MGRTPSRRRTASLAVVLAFVSAAAAAQTPSQRAFREVRTAADRGNWLAAEQLVDDALRRFAVSDDDATWALRVIHAEILLGCGKYAEARKVLGQELPRRLQHSATAVQRLRNLTMWAILTANADEAKSSLARAQALASQHQPALIPQVLLLVQYVDPKNGDTALKKALRLAKQGGDEVTELRISLTMMERRLREARWAEGIRIGESILPRMRALHLDAFAEKAGGNLGWGLREIGDSESAAHYVAEAEQTAARIGAVNDRVPWLVQLGNIHTDRRDFARAEKYYRQAYEIAKPIGHWQTGYCAANLSVIAIETGHFADARRFNAEAIELKKQQDDAEAILRSKIIDARIDAASGAYDDAARKMKSVSAETKLASTKWEAQARLAGVYIRAKRTTDADAQFRSALSTVRMARAAIDNVELRLSFLHSAREIIDDYVDFLVDAGRVEDALAVTETISGQTLEEGLGIAAQKQPLEPRAIARESGAAILCYHLGANRSYVWTVTPGDVKVASLPARADVAAAVDAYLRDLLGPRGSLAMSGARGAGLYRMLVEPTGVRGGPVIVIADDRLSALNFETLVVPKPKPHYWIEDATLRNAPSLQLLARGSGRPNTNTTMLLVGNAPQADPAYPALPRAGLEIERVRRRFANPVVLAGAKATPDAYRAALPQSFDFVHFAAHGEATQSKPLDSAVILARGAGGYKLLARDIVKQPLSARLVTISGCYGAGTRMYVGEGLVGLAWAFLRAGAQQVVAGLWQVSDAATPELMDQMYAGIRAGRDPATALRDAKLTLLRSSGAYRKPMYWAPFVLYSGG
jgi:tetratricopeptide (TPR) repeat protein